MTRYLLLLGSNVEREANLARGEAMLERKFEVLARSRAFESEAVGDPEGPPFLNRAVLVRSALDPRALRRALQAAESALGRVRTPDRHAPRTIDVDLLLGLDESGAVLPEPAPHRDLARHHHAAIPAAEIAGDAALPGGRTLAEVAASLGPPPRGFRAVTDPP